MKTMTRFSILLCMIFLLSCQTKYQKLPEKLTEPGKVLSGKEIHSVFSGKTLEGQGIRNLQRTYFAKDGSLIVVNNRDGYFDTNRRKLVGKWWINGDYLCFRYNRRQPNCGSCHIIHCQDKLEKDFCSRIESDRKGGLVGKGCSYKKILVDNPYRK